MNNKAGGIKHPAITPIGFNSHHLANANIPKGINGNKYKCSIPNIIAAVIYPHQKNTKLASVKCPKEIFLKSVVL